MKLAELLLLVLPFSLLGTPPAEAGEMRALRVEGTLRSYYLHAPATAKPGAPLVIMLHGAGGSGQDDTVRFGWRRKAEIEGFVVAGPDASPLYSGRPIDGQANPRVWNDAAPFILPSTRASEDVALIVALIDELARTRQIDRRRVYIAGFSSGGNMASRLVQEIPDRLAGVMIAAGQFHETRPALTRGVPILYFSGDADPANPVNGADVSTGWGTVMRKEPHRVLLDRWRKLNGCPSALLALPDPNAFEHVEVVGPCRDGSEVRYILVRGLAHEWPVDERGRSSDTVSATNEAWTFFKRFRLPAGP